MNNGASLFLCAADLATAAWLPAVLTIRRSVLVEFPEAGNQMARPVITGAAERTCIRGRQPTEVGESAALPAEHSRPRRDEKDHLGESSAESGLSAEGEIAKAGFRTLPELGRMSASLVGGLGRQSPRHSNSNSTWPSIGGALCPAPRRRFGGSSAHRRSSG